MYIIVKSFEENLYPLIIDMKFHMFLLLVKSLFLFG